MEKFEKAKKMAAQQAKDTAPEQRKAVGLEGNNSAVGGDPITGLLKATGAFVVGAANAIGSNSLLGAGRQDPSTFGEYAGYAETGQTYGNLISIVQGTAEVLLSAVGTGTEVVTAPFTGGASAVAIAPTIALGVHGAGTASTAVSNLLSPSRVEARGQNRIPDTGGPSNGTQSNKPNTTVKKYNSDGKVVKEWNKGHPDHPKNSKNYNDHIHDYKTAGDKSSRQPARTPKKNEVLKDFRPN